MSASRRTELRYPGGMRALYGAVAFLASYLAFLPVAALRYESLLADATVTVGGVTYEVAENLAPESVSTVEGAGHLLFNAQFVPLSVPMDLGVGTAAATVNPLLQAGGVHLLSLLVPAVAFAVSGALATRGVSTSRPLRRARTAAMQFTGVAPLVLISIPIVSVSASGGNAGPGLLWGIFGAGVFYPAGAGAVGGYLAHKRAGF
ncbi:hypothetical protein [Haloparvum sedimenti]|uniref:hypothetical protein n=1 Tax=Haloparvum sedimenti TaxID=1678448 RepID=UPI00071E887B|nr:hypothetical protein [Haloparvum sedimenti]